MVPSISNPMDLFCNNNGPIAQAKEPRSRQRSKHISRRFNLVKRPTLLKAQAFRRVSFDMVSEPSLARGPWFKSPLCSLFLIC